MSVHPWPTDKDGELVRPARAAFGVAAGYRQPPDQILAQVAARRSVSETTEAAHEAGLALTGWRQACDEIIGRINAVWEESMAATVWTDDPAAYHRGGLRVAANIAEEVRRGRPPLTSISDPPPPPPSADTITGLGPCAACDHDPACGFASVYSNGTQRWYCHADDHSCYAPSPPSADTVPPWIDARAVRDAELLAEIKAAGCPDDCPWCSEHYKRHDPGCQDTWCKGYRRHAPDCLWLRIEAR